MEQDQEAESTRLMLDVIENRDRVTQRDLAGELGIALGLTNVYLKRCINKGLIKVRKAPARRYAYYLTAKGFSEKARLTAKFLSRSLRFFRLAREDCSNLFVAAQARGVRKVALIGASDLSEIAVLAALDAGVEIVGVLDEETNRQQLAGVPILRSLHELAAADAVVITDSRDPQAAYDRMLGELAAEKILYPSLLRLTSRPPSRPGGMLR